MTSQSGVFQGRKSREKKKQKQQHHQRLTGLGLSSTASVAAKSSRGRPVPQSLSCGHLDCCHQALSGCYLFPGGNGKEKSVELRERKRQYLPGLRGYLSSTERDIREAVQTQGARRTRLKEARGPAGRQSFRRPSLFLGVVSQLSARDVTNNHRGARLRKHRQRLSEYCYTPRPRYDTRKTDRESPLRRVNTFRQQPARFVLQEWCREKDLQLGPLPLQGNSFVPRPG